MNCPACNGSVELVLIPAIAERVPARPKCKLVVQCHKCGIPNPRFKENTSFTPYQKPICSTCFWGYYAVDFLCTEDGRCGGCEECKRILALIKEAKKPTCEICGIEGYAGSSIYTICPACTFGMGVSKVWTENCQEGFRCGCFWRCEECRKMLPKDEPLADSRDDLVVPEEGDGPSPLLRDRITKEGSYVKVGNGLYYAGQCDRDGNMVTVSLFHEALEEITDDVDWEESYYKREAQYSESLKCERFFAMLCAICACLVTGLVCSLL